jgi:LytR cell envelope-related transcriptional attenuator
MAYMEESGASIHRRRRRRRAAITLTLVGLMMVGTFAYAAAYFQGWVGTRTPKPVASGACQVATPAQALKPSAVTINVYNATNRSGLAASVAKSLRAQGFKVGKVANDPLGKSIAGVGEVRHGQTGAAGATLAATRLSGAKVVPDERADATVDLVLGNAFTTLRAPPKVAPSKATKSTPSPTASC